MPIVRDPLDPTISMWHFLAFYMRYWREKEGLSLTQCGQIINAARSTVCNMEAGRQRPHDDQMRMLDKKYGTGMLFQLLLWYARMAHDPEWFHQYSQYETQSLAIRIFHGGGIPLHLQTDECTTAYMRSSSHSDHGAELAEHLARKRLILGRETPPDIWVVLDEAVLARPVGDNEAMKRQLRHLLTAMDLPHVSLRIVPFSSGIHPGVEGFFQVISLESRDVAYAGAQSGGRLIESPSEIRALRDRFDRIGAKAASEDASCDIIKQYLERYP
ncbi:Scr1 family TA system antitoxin-like transcriptional regulator [Actinomadura sp. 9N407]|uniref:helix-turn-helix domain-containing protein n=1 Tax=Actinomadura sp. 9N407 TaxID=3375154 RepID=UPI0037BBECC8